MCITKYIDEKESKEIGWEYSEPEDVAPVTQFCFSMWNILDCTRPAIFANFSKLPDDPGNKFGKASMIGCTNCSYVFFKLALASLSKLVPARIHWSADTVSTSMIWHFPHKYEIRTKPLIFKVWKQKDLHFPVKCNLTTPVKLLHIYLVACSDKDECECYTSCFHTRNNRHFLISLEVKPSCDFCKIFDSKNHSWWVSISFIKSSEAPKTCSQEKNSKHHHECWSEHCHHHSYKMAFLWLMHDIGV